MPRFYFDIRDGGPHRDDVGLEFESLEEARSQAIRTLPDLARESIPESGDRRTFTVLVSDEDGRAVYAATLTYTGLWLLR